MRIDKYDPVSGGFRAPLLADRAKSTTAVGGAAPAIGMGPDNQGRLVPGKGNCASVKGIVCLSSDLKAGSPADVMTDGEIVEFGGVAGTDYQCDDVTGAIAAGPGTAAGKTYIGHTIEADRLIVRVARKADA